MLQSFIVFYYVIRYRLQPFFFLIIYNHNVSTPWFYLHLMLISYQVLAIIIIIIFYMFIFQTPWPPDTDAIRTAATGYSIDTIVFCGLISLSRPLFSATSMCPVCNIIHLGRMHSHHGNPSRTRSPWPALVPQPTV